MASHSENSAEASNLMAVDLDASKSEYGDDEKGRDLEKKDPLPCPEEQAEEAMKAKYGKLKPRRPPLIAMDHEHAFFDSADWALGKQGSQKNKGPLEALRPKLQPSPHHHVRAGRSTYASEADDHEGSNENSKVSDEEGKPEHGFTDNVHPISPSREN